MRTLDQIRDDATAADYVEEDACVICGETRVPLAWACGEDWHCAQGYGCQDPEADNEDREGFEE